MDIATLISIIITLSAIAMAVMIFIRASRSGYLEEEPRPSSFELKNQQISSQFIILARYAIRLVASWEYLLLSITLISMALVLSHPIEGGETPSARSVPVGINLPRDILILYSSSGLNLTEGLERPSVVKIYLGILGEPAVIQAGQRIYRAFSIIIIDCSPGSNILDQRPGLGEILISICRAGENSYTYFVTNRPVENIDYSDAMLYYKDKGSVIKLKAYNETSLRSLNSLPCINTYLPNFIRSMGYEGGLVTYSKEFTGFFKLDMPNIAIAVRDSSTDIANWFKNTGAEAICTGAQEPGKALVYTISHRPLARQLLDIAIAGLAGGVILIIFNRSVIPRIIPGGDAILISGGTFWISRLLPLVSIAIVELFSIFVMTLSYASSISFEAYGEPFISAPGFLLASLISLTISFAHLALQKTPYYSATMAYFERAIPARGYSYVVEGISYRDIADLITESLEKSEFFSVLEKEAMEREDAMNVRLRLLYRYSIGVGADVNLYASKHNEGSFIDIDIEPWSVDDTRGGILDSVTRMILSRISGAIIVGRISKGLDKD